jgi:hypothetical protein
VFKQFEEVFEHILEGSEGRFLYASLLCNLLKCDYGLKLTAVVNLPKGEDLYAHYLSQIKQVLVEKEWDWVKRILLILAATEAAAAEDFNLLSGGSEGFDWQGIKSLIYSKISPSSP